MNRESLRKFGADTAFATRAKFGDLRITYQVEHGHEPTRWVEERTDWPATRDVLVFKNKDERKAWLAHGEQQTEYPTQAGYCEEIEPGDVRLSPDKAECSDPECEHKYDDGVETDRLTRVTVVDADADPNRSAWFGNSPEDTAAFKYERA